MLVLNRCSFESRGCRIGGVIEKVKSAMTGLKPKEFCMCYWVVCSKTPIDFSHNKRVITSLRSYFQNNDGICISTALDGSESQSRASGRERGTTK